MGLVTGNVEKKEVTNVYAWGLVVAMGGWFAWTAFFSDDLAAGLATSPGNVFVVSLVVACALNGLFVYHDMVHNDMELTPFRFFLGFTLVPIWLWVRASGARVGRTPFWTYLLVMLLGSITLAVNVDARTTAQRATSALLSSPVVPNGVVAIPAATATAHAGTPNTTASSSPWSVSAQVDKLTDRETVKAVIRAVVSDNPKLLYELTLRCDESTRVASLAAFEDVGLGVLPRMLPLETRVTGDSIVQYKEFSFRHDSGAAQRGMLVGGHGQDANTAAWNELTVTFRVESARIDSWNTTVAEARAGKVAYIDAHTGAGRSTSWASLLQLRPHVLTMPSARLVVADVFPNETVEFSFSTLTATERGAVESACFPPSPSMAAVPEPSAGTPWENLPEVPPWDQLDSAPTASTPEASEPNPAAARSTHTPPSDH